jgi:hypothetical protein
MATDTYTLGPGTLTIGETTGLKTFSGQVTNCRLVPNVDRGDAINVLDGGSVAGDRSETFTLEGTMLQDFGGTNSLTEWLYTNSGTQQPFTFTPNTARGKKLDGQLVIEATEIGGDVKTKPTADFEFEVIGKPVIGTVV